MTMQVIQHTELGSGQATITFSSIPSTYTDLMVVYSLRVSNTSFANVVYVSFNGSTSNFSGRYLEGNGSSAASGSLGRYVGAYNNPTASTFGNGQLYIPNYAGSTAKSFSVDSVTEANATASYQDIIAGLWNDTSAINSITFSLTTADTFVTGSSATLYGILKGSAGGVTVS